MIYVRNVTNVDQWLVDPATGIGRKVTAGSLARVKADVGEQLVREHPQLWAKVPIISLGPPQTSS